MAAGAGAVATLAALAVPAAAMGGPNPYDDAQVGLTSPVYQPMTVLGLPLTSFKLLPCAAGQDESVSATYGKAYTPISNFGKLPGFSIAEGYPDICSNPGISWQVGIWNVGIPKDMVSVKVFSVCKRPSRAKELHRGQWGQERLRPPVNFPAVPVRHQPGKAD